MSQIRRQRPTVRARLTLGAIALCLALVGGVGCGEENGDPPSAPDGSRAQPTGTVTTTVPATTASR